MSNENLKEFNLESLAEQLKGHIYDELPKQFQWRVTVYGGGIPFGTDEWHRSYPVPDLKTGYIVREIICNEYTRLGIFDGAYTIVHVECLNPKTPEDGWYEWFSPNGDDLDLYEMDENFNLYLKVFWEE